MAIPMIHNPTGRRCEARVVSIGEREFFFSYTTCVAYRGPAPHATTTTCVRRESNFSPTTARQMREMGCYDFARVPDDEFEQLASIMDH